MSFRGARNTIRCVSILGFISARLGQTAKKKKSHTEHRGRARCPQMGADVGDLVVCLLVWGRGPRRRGSGGKRSKSGTKAGGATSQPLVMDMNADLVPCEQEKKEGGIGLSVSGQGWECFVVGVGEQAGGAKWEGRT